MQSIAMAVPACLLQPAARCGESKSRKLRGAILPVDHGYHSQYGFRECNKCERCSERAFSKSTADSFQDRFTRRGHSQITLDAESASDSMDFHHPPSTHQSRYTQSSNLPLLIPRLALNSVPRAPPHLHRRALAPLDAVQADRLRDAVLLMRLQTPSGLGLEGECVALVSCVSRGLLR